jgi:hypothetical protein
MKLLAVFVAVLLLSPSAQADNIVVWFVEQGKKEVLLPIWKVEAVERGDGKLTVRTSSVVVTVVPKSEASELQNLDGSAVFYWAFDRLIGHDSAVTTEAYEAAVKTMKSKGVDVETRQKNAAMILAYNRVFPCSSITVRDVGGN